MATRFLDTGEAYLSAADKHFARVAEVPVHIESARGDALSPALVAVLLAIAVVGLAILAFAI